MKPVSKSALCAMIGRAARKVEKLAHGLRLVRRAGHIGIRNAGQCA